MDRARIDERLAHMLEILNDSLPVVYAVAIVMYFWAFRTQHATAKRVKSYLLLLVLALHGAYLGVRTAAFDHPPITSIPEMLTVTSFAIALSYALIEKRSGIRNTGVFILSIAGAFQLVSTLTIEPLLDVPEHLRSVLLGIHVATALSGLAAFAISAGYAVLYLVLYHQLKRARFGILYDRLPNLEALESLVTSSIVIGFLLLTVAIVLGTIWFERVIDEPSWLDPKLIGTALVWLVYGIGILRHRVIQWGGRSMMFVSIAGFTLSLVSLTVVNLFFTSFHSFR
jgi:ABC-type transport system involved in cytochrome c biogenesis permease subunit